MGDDGAMADAAVTRVRGEGIHEFAWRAWIPVSWGLPLLFVLFGFVGGPGGWESLIVLLLSPIIVPVVGLLGMLPRMILTRTRHRAMQREITWLLFLNWWATAMVIVAMPGTGDSGELPSFLGDVFGASRVPPGATPVLFGGAVVVMIVSGIMLVLLAVSSDPSRPHVNPRWTIAAWVAAIAVPIVVVAAISLGAFSGLEFAR